MYDPTRDYLLHKEEYDNAIQNVLNTGCFINGMQTKELEKKLSEYVDVKHCISCANGTDAIELALMALDIKKGDKIITVSHTFTSTVEVICHLGATPILIDVNTEDFCIDIDKLESYLSEHSTSDIKGIICVSLYGQMPNYFRIMEISERYNIPVIEDGAQSFGAMINGLKSCSIAKISTTSFFPTKPLGCYGDGGACFTNCEEIASKIRALKNHGAEKKFVNKYIGINSRLDTIQASILLVKLQYLDESLMKRSRCANMYNRLLKDRDDIYLPKILSDRIHVWAQYTIIVKSKNRDDIIQHMSNKNVPSAIFYPQGIHQQECYKNICEYDDLSVTENLCKKIINLPCYPDITFEEQKRVCQVLIEALES